MISDQQYPDMETFIHSHPRANLMSWILRGGLTEADLDTPLGRLLPWVDIIAPDDLDGGVADEPMDVALGEALAADGAVEVHENGN
jgi:hypothetical protein